MSEERHESGGDGRDGTRAGEPLSEDRLDPTRQLRDAMGRAPRSDELELWASMPTDRREKSLERIPVLRRWVEEPGEMTAAEAAGLTGMALSRFYEVAAAWKAAPTLASLGTFAKRPGRRGERLDPEAVNAIQSVLPRIVGADPMSKVGSLVAKLQADAAVQGLKLPHSNTLRVMVEREKRRLAAEKKAGLRPGFDACAIELIRENGAPHVMFAVVDRSSRLILGFAIGDVGDSRDGHARAARDAVERMSAPDAPVLPWADLTERFDVIVGDDVGRWRREHDAYVADRRKPEFGLVERDGRYGRYLKLAAGRSLGGIALHPVRTGTADRSLGGRVYSDADAVTAIEIEVVRHNAAVMAANVAEGATRPPPGLGEVLRFVAGG